MLKHEGNQKMKHGTTKQIVTDSDDCWHMNYPYNARGPAFAATIA